MVEGANATLPDRLWAFVEKTDSCWLWTGSKTRVGYGQMRVGGAGSRKTGVHRVAYELLVGRIPKGLDLDHLCRNTLCVNPDHLEPVTRKENLARGIHVATNCRDGVVRRTREARFTCVS